MLLIHENDIYDDISYDVQTIIDEKVIEKHNIRCKASKIKINDTIYYLLFDRYYQLNKKAFNYINIYMRELNKSIQTREKTLVALKYLYSYLAIFNIEIEDLTNDEAAKFISFLIGQSTQGKEVTLFFKNTRSPSTVNDYLHLIRKYIQYLNIEKHPLLDSRGERNIQNVLTNNVYSVPLFNIGVKNYHRDEVPKHITLDEYKIMLKHTNEQDDKRLMCIIRLMYESGLRVGEVLGLTFEDLVQVIDTKGDTIYKVILRNRVSDKSYQSAKFLMKPRSSKDYKSKSYKTKGYGYDEMYISSSLYEALMDYIDEAHTNAQESHTTLWENNTVTDSVDTTFDEDENFYIFINSIGKPLSNVTLFQYIKDLFITCGIKINDDGGKYDGLCHRFRHGFAMYQVNYNHVDMLLLKELMRHRNVTSTSVYYTPEATTIVKIKDDLSKSVYELIPEFDVEEE